MTGRDVAPRDAILYYADWLPGERAQLRCDVIVEGELVLSYPVGSPAPLASVVRAAHEQSRVFAP